MRPHSCDAAKSPDELDAEAFELEARAAVLHAEAARQRARSSRPGDAGWIAAVSLPLPRKTVLAACRSGELRAVKRGRTWVTTLADADAFLSRAKEIANDTLHANVDDELREKFGLERRAG